MTLYKTIADLDPASTVNDTDQFELSQFGTSRRVSLTQLRAGAAGVTSVSVVSANGLAGSVATPTTTPAITLSTTISGLLKGNGTAISAAVAGTDYVTPAGLPTVPAGSVAYGGAGGAITGVLADFAWDATNKRLGIGVAAPAYKFHIAVPTGDIFTIDNSGIVSASGGINAVSAAALLAGGDWWFGYHLGTGSGGYLGLFGGTGAPTLSTFGKFGSVYLNASTPGLPWYNNNGTTGWDRLVGETSTQTLSNKTITGYLASGASASGDLTGTYPGPTIKTDVALAGNPTTTTQATADNSTRIATTAYVKANVAASSNKLLQTVSTVTGTVATGATSLPWDNTIPQITEGVEFMTRTITPQSTSSQLIIDVTFNCCANANDIISVALFRDAVANALAATAIDGGRAANLPINVKFTHVMTPGSLTPITFRVRAGTNGANTVTFNGSGGTGLFGGVMASSIVITEVLP